MEFGGMKDRCAGCGRVRGCKPGEYCANCSSLINKGRQMEQLSIKTMPPKLIIEIELHEQGMASLGFPNAAQKALGRLVNMNVFGDCATVIKVQVVDSDGETQYAFRGFSEKEWT